MLPIKAVFVSKQTKRPEELIAHYHKGVEIQAPQTPRAAALKTVKERLRCSGHVLEYVIPVLTGETRMMRLLFSGTNNAFLSRNKLESCLLCGAVALYVISFTLSFTNIDMVKPQALRYFRIISQAVALFFLMGKLTLGKYSKSKLVVLLAGLTMLLVCFACAGSDAIPFIWTLLFVFAARDEDIRAAAVACLIALSGVLIFTAIGSQLGLIPDVVWTMQGIEIKRSLGFNHPNQLGLMLFSIAGAFSIARQGTFKAIDICAYLTIGFLLFEVSGARTSEIAYISLMALLLLNRTGIRKKTLLAACIVLFAIIVVFSIGIMLFYDPSNNLLNKLNSLLSERFYYWNLYASTYPPTLFGRNFEELVVPRTAFQDSSEAFITDNVYCFTALHLGIIPLLAFTGAAAAVLFMAFKSDRCDAATLVFIAFLIFGFGETHSFWIGLNISLLVVTRCLDTRTEKPRKTTQMA